MPSIHKFMVFVALTVSFLSTSSAAPATDCHTRTPTPSASHPAPTPTLPTNGGGTELPAPTGTFKFVTIGRGVQNYSCNATGAVPVAVGAVANLFDFTTLAYTRLAALHAVTGIIVYEPRAAAGGSKISIPGLGDFPRIGQHYFDATGTPVFSLDAVGNKLFAKKIASVNAPANAPIGPDGTGVVPWLTLNDKGGSQGLSEVYRVVTAGGKAPASCPDNNLISIQYAAEYWFYA